jgi:hypothetical protein
MSESLEGSRLIRKHLGERPWKCDPQKPPDVLQERRTSNELVEQIRKLRWMGLEEEAMIVQDELNLRRATADSVIAASHDTD